MKRKINRIGKNSLSVSLPQELAEKCELKVNEEVEIEEKDGNIIISKTNIEKRIKRIILDLSNVDRNIGKYLRACYKCGYDEVEIHFKDSCLFTDVSSMIKELIGFEIISQRPGYYLIKNVASPIKKTFLDLLEKNYQITIKMADDILKSFKDNNSESLTEIELQEAIQNKLTSAGFRLIIEDGENVVKGSYFNYTILSLLETIADNFKYICQYYSNKKIELSLEAENVFKLVISFLKDTYRMYLDHNVNHSFGGLRKINHDELTQFIETAPNHEKMLGSYLLIIYLIVYDIRREIYPLLLEEININNQNNR